MKTIRYEPDRKHLVPSYALDKMRLRLEKQSVSKKKLTESISGLLQNTFTEKQHHDEIWHEEYCAVGICEVSRHLMVPANETLRFLTALYVESEDNQEQPVRLGSLETAVIETLDMLECFPLNYSIDYVIGVVTSIMSQHGNHSTYPNLLAKMFASVRKRRIPFRHLSEHFQQRMYENTRGLDRGKVFGRRTLFLDYNEYDDILLLGHDRLVYRTLISAATKLTHRTQA